MTKLISILAIVILSKSAAVAQKRDNIDSILKLKIIDCEKPLTSTNTLRKQLGNLVNIHARILGVKFVNDSLKILYIDKKHPYHSAVILLKGKETIHQLNYLCNGISKHFRGVVIIYDRKPAIIITNQFQVGEQIQI